MNEDKEGLELRGKGFADNAKISEPKPDKNTGANFFWVQNGNSLIKILNHTRNPTYSWRQKPNTGTNLADTFWAHRCGLGMFLLFLFSVLDSNMGFSFFL